MAANRMLSRYDTNDYRKSVHISLHGDTVPVPHARTWFPEDTQDGTANSRGGRMYRRKMEVTTMPLLLVP